jgi:hypothetical protein
MRKLILSGVFACFSLLVCAQSIGPQVINCSGGSYDPPGNFRFDWSVGEMTLVNTMQSGLFVLTNGFLQPTKYGTVKGKNEDTRIMEVKDVTLSSIQVYPNPTSDFIQVNLDMPGAGQIRMVLYNQEGKQLWSREELKKPARSTERISLSTFPQGNYLLLVEWRPAEGGPASTGSYKIIKMN